MGPFWTIVSQVVTAGGALLAVVLTLRGQQRREQRRDTVAAYARTVRALHDYRHAMFAVTSLRLAGRLQEGGAEHERVRSLLAEAGVRMDAVEVDPERTARARTRSREARSELEESSAALVLLAGSAEVGALVHDATRACVDIRNAASFVSLQEARRHAKTQGEALLALGQRHLNGRPGRRGVCRPALGLRPGTEFESGA